MAQQQKAGKPWSGNNPIPNVKQFLEGLDKDKAERDKRIDEQSQRSPKAQDKVTPHKNETKTSKGKTVTDPTTGNDVVIDNVGKDFMQHVTDPQLSVPNANLGRPTPVKTDASQPNPEYKEKQDITAPPDPIEPGSTSDVPIHGEKTNILFHPTPSVSYEPMFESLEKRAGALCIGILIATLVVGKVFGGALKGLIPLAMVITSGVWLWMKEVVRSGREVEWSSEQSRGETAVANLLPESVEWMNTFMKVVWGLINPDMFIPIADQIEDVMVASVPGVIENVRVAEIHQGNNPFRVLSLRALPDKQVQELKDSIHEQNKKIKDPQEAAADEEGGDYYNLEISFAYHAAPTKGDSPDAKARNMHMNLVFYLGIRGLFGVPLPIFVELQELVGTVRLRLQLTPDPPYAKNLTFTLMGVPHVQAGCIPMIKKGPNLLNLPLISNFVNYAIGAAASLYVAPKSMSLDLRSMLQGDDVTKDVQALGVMWVRIHRAVGLSKQDRRGSKGGGSDPYINLSFSKYGKPMYCTRVITDDLNPMWEETAALLVTPDLIKADEQLSVELWDSDRNSADDIVGKVELSMQKMIQHPGKMYPQISKLAGMQDGTEMPGELHWEVGYFGKPKIRPALRTDGKDKTLPDNLKDEPSLQDEKGNTTSEFDDAVAHTPPDPLWPSGVCSVIVHQIVNLELENIKGTEGNRKGKEYEPAKAYGESTEEQSKKLPTSYCTILLNDQLAYRTRAKAVSSKPIFNAGTERFVRDWRSTIVTVTVRDQRYREHDPILGVVPLKLSDILTTSSQVTRWYPLDGGIGFGRIRISLLFRSVETRLPPNMLGWDVGTFEFLSDRILALGKFTKGTKLKLRTGGSVGHVSRKQCHSLEEGDGIYWDMAHKETKSEVRLPVKYRYRSPVVFEFHQPGKRGAVAFAQIWLQHLVDNEDTPIDIPIWTTKNPNRLTQNYVTEFNVKAKEVPGLEDLTEIGRLTFRGRFKAGTDESHERFVVDNDSRETYETWEACLAEGVRESQVSPEIPDHLQEMHEKSLTEGRDILKQVSEEEREKWVSKTGQDWSGAFGHDPAAYADGKGRKIAEPGTDKPPHDPVNPSSDDDSGDDDDSESDSDLGINDANSAPKASMDTQHTNGTNSTDATTTDSRASGESKGSSKDVNKVNSRSEKRKHRGLMQWRPARNAQFAADEAKFAARRMKNKFTGGLGGREPGVETETGR
ncbi:putative meiotically up-regulated protein [Phaeomoniella chlamydospora]|uniref:Putative meiotically up-regulated protein n=1 Tax=Phaeomoniella chlamydospora TaxID=158046 RepID=A0A0G2E679_PHACM|nr:putative meiotically up-regulated protein [Phaeomoniella chlamydospora]